MTIPIKQLKVHKLHMTLKHPFSTSFGTMQKKEFFIIEMIDQDGHRGFGESVAFTIPWYTEETVRTVFHIMDEFLIPLLQNSKINHPDEVSSLFQTIKGNRMAKAALEGAVWDLYAKRNNLSLAEALGGSRTEIASGISIGIQPTINDLLKVIDKSLSQGYKRMKLKIKPGWDVKVLREVRHHFPEVPIMVDANSAYTLADLETLKSLDEFNLLMIEQPFQEDDFIQHAKLQKVIATPICLDESILSVQDAKLAYELGCCKIINIKIGRVGGLTEARRIHDFCKEKGLAVWCGGMLEAGVGRAHCIALSSLPQFTLPGDISGSNRYWEKDIIEPEVIVENGLIQVPQSAGIGFTVNEKVMDEYTEWVKVYHFM